MIWRLLFLVIAPGALLATTSRGNGGAKPEALDHFERRIRPVFVEHCYACHSEEAKQKKKLRGDLYLDSAGGWKRGGTSGPSIVPGKPAESLLLKAMRHEDDVQMPPNTKLPPQVLADFEQWIADGAADPRDGARALAANTLDLEAAKKEWIFQPIRKPPVPEARQGDAVKSPIDAFLLARLEASGLAFAPPSDPRTLLRRLHHDLAGLPPTAEQVDAFAQAWAEHRPGTQTPTEIEVDRLLASPHFGVRWARHWLDLVRYAARSPNSNEFIGTSDPSPYRDWVAEALNADIPYRDFMQAQIAGDLMPPAELHGLANSRYAIAPLGMGVNRQQDDDGKRADVVDEQVEIVGSVFLGPTLHCARCHNHKFDPITQADYYGLAGIFFSTHLEMAPSGEADAVAEFDRLETQIQPLEAKLRAVRPSLSKPATEESKALAAQIQELRKKQPKVNKTPSLGEGGVAGKNLRYQGIQDVHLYVRGSVSDPGPLVPRRLPVVFAGAAQKPLGERTSQSGRLELARWLASADNPLPARVLVNRVWAQLLGRGIVATPSNFGKLGAAPTHPELVDHLAATFIDEGWSIKKLIRAIVLSTAYQQSSRPPAAALQADPDNKLFSRQRRKRLESEVLRDHLVLAGGGMLAIGEEARALFGPGDALKKGSLAPRAFYFPAESRRRSNANSDGIADAFDAADPNIIQSVRNDSTVTQQALLMLNNPFVLQAAADLAKRADGGSATERIARVYRTLLAREPTEAENTRGERFLAEGTGPNTWRLYVHALLCSNEFLYVD